MGRIVVATNNENKVREIKAVISGMAESIGINEFQSMKDIGLNPEITENGSTFEENALIKAMAVAKLCHDNDTIVIADDSGLEVDYLNKKPGIFSARYLGYDTPQEYKNRNIIDKLHNIPDEKRTARFVCAIAAVFPDNTVSIVCRELEGRIAQAPAGTNGFAYDPIFIIPEYNKTVAELDNETKNKISHRAKALNAITKIIGDWKATCQNAESMSETLKRYAQFTVCSNSDGWHSMLLFDKSDKLTNPKISPIAKIAPDNNICRLYQTAIKYCEKNGCKRQKKAVSFTVRNILTLIIISAALTASIICAVKFITATTSPKTAKTNNSTIIVQTIEDFIKH